MDVHVKRIEDCLEKFFRILYLLNRNKLLLCKERMSKAHEKTKVYFMMTNGVERCFIGTTK